MDVRCGRVAHRTRPSQSSPQPHGRSHRSPMIKLCNQSDTLDRGPQREPTTTQPWPLPVGDERRTVSMRWRHGARMCEGDSMLLLDVLAINRRIGRGSACPRGARQRRRRLNPGARRHSGGGLAERLRRRGCRHRRRQGRKATAGPGLASRDGLGGRPDRGSRWVVSRLLPAPRPRQEVEPCPRRVPEPCSDVGAGIFRCDVRRRRAPGAPGGPFFSATR